MSHVSFYHMNCFLNLHSLSFQDGGFTTNLVIVFYLLHFQLFSTLLLNFLGTNSFFCADVQLNTIQKKKKQSEESLTVMLLQHPQLCCCSILKARLEDEAWIKVRMRVERP